MEVDKFVTTLPKEDHPKSLDNYGYILVDTMQDAIDTVNEIASEHLRACDKKSI